MSSNVSLTSVFLGRDCDLLPSMFSFYAPFASEVRDVTANKRKMWKGLHFDFNLRFYDIDPEVEPDFVCSWNNLPDGDGSVDVLVYDPPHLPMAAASDKSDRGFVNRYGLAKSVKADNIRSLHPSFLCEANRVLKKDGLIFAKIKDYVHNHKYQWNLMYFLEECQMVGLTACDLIIKRDPQAGNLKSSRWKQSHHVRNVHCYWVVIRKGRCEPMSKKHQKP